MRKLFLVVVLGSFVVVAMAQEPEQAAEKHVVTIDDLLSFKTVSDVRISPDGKWILYVITTPDLKENERNADIYRVPADGGDPIKMTASPKSDSSPRWSPDGQTIAFLSSRDGKTQIYTMHAFGGEADKLTKHDESVSGFEWRPDGKAILFRARVPLTKKEKADRKAKKDQIVIDENLRPQHLWIFDLETKEAEQVTKGDFSVQSFEWSQDGSEIAYSAADKPTAFDRMAHVDIFTVKPGEEPAKLYANDGPDGSPSFSPDGSKVAFISRLGALNPIGSNSLMLLDRNSGEAKSLTQNLGGFLGRFFWAPSGDGIYFQAYDKTTVQLYYYGLQKGGFTRLTDDAGVYQSFDVNSDGSAAAFVYQDPQTPPDIYVADFSAGKPFDKRRLTEINPAIKDWKLGRTEVAKWNSPDGREIEGVFTYPVDFKEGEQCPLIVLIHGGPSGVFTQRFHDNWYYCNHYFAGRGWAMLMPNVRGSIGYGNEFQQANINDWGGGDYNDIISGVDHLVASGVADPEKLAVRGWSYGGYMTAWVVTQTGRFKAASVGAGLTNLESMYGTNDIPQVLERYFSGDIYGESLALYRERSPLVHVGNVVTPTLVLHGQNDTRVPIGQAQEFYYAVKKRGVPAQLVFYPREGHGPREINHQRDILQRWTIWFSRHVLGEEVTFEEEKADEEDEPAEDKEEKQL